MVIKMSRKLDTFECREESRGDELWTALIMQTSYFYGTSSPSTRRTHIEVNYNMRMGGRDPLCAGHEVEGYVIGRKERAGK